MYKVSPRYLVLQWILRREGKEVDVFLDTTGGKRRMTKEWLALKKNRQSFLIKGDTKITHG